MKIYKYNNNIDTDVIIPARYLNTSNPKELVKYCMIDIDKNFAQTVEMGDIIIGGENFGCGSSREHAPIVIKESGIKCIIAKSFARIFYRNSINVGLPIIESSEAVNDIDISDSIEIDFKLGIIKNITKNKEYQINKFPEFIQNIINKNGLLNSLKGDKNE